MSLSSQDSDYAMKVEIQKILGRINNDMNKLQNELQAVNALVEDNAALSTTSKLVNEKLIMTAKDAGIDLEMINGFVNFDLEKESAENADIGHSKGRTSLGSNASAITNTINELTETMKLINKN